MKENICCDSHDFVVFLLFKKTVSKPHKCCDNHQPKCVTRHTLMEHKQYDFKLKVVHSKLSLSLFRERDLNPGL